MNIRRITALAFVLAIIALVIVFSSCQRMASMMPTDDEMSEMTPSREIPIGVVVALTGPHAEPYGLPMQRGFELA